MFCFFFFFWGEDEDETTTGFHHHRLPHHHRIVLPCQQPSSERLHTEEEQVKLVKLLIKFFVAQFIFFCYFAAINIPLVIITIYIITLCKTRNVHGNEIYDGSFATLPPVTQHCNNSRTWVDVGPRVRLGPVRPDGGRLGERERERGLNNGDFVFVHSPREYFKIG